ncbi:cytochrome c maturation protein CcmE [Sphingomicrobium nitratireducens]|uniref:cytochrome c maturation protein CcmE n=1 Tax=Sphingomicrobium nitratireducens TaxID=2964666 RepID=UPI00223F2AF2|nr:cytochrome c maturation protein CcmE [Sphingomicrobium nitratireducens]
MMMRPKNQRLVLVSAALVALGLAALLALWGLQDRAAYFVTPSEIVAGKLEPGQSARLGGMVEEGSLQQLDDGVSVRFSVHDGDKAVAVTHAGILPDLFREGSGVVAEGRLGPDGVFIADRILAKHDERYMPPELDHLETAAETVER